MVGTLILKSYVTSSTRTDMTCSFQLLKLLAFMKRPSRVAPYYKDEVILILSKAIHYSFKTAKVAMIVSIVNIPDASSYHMCKCTNDLSIITLSLPSLPHIYPGSSQSH